MSGRDISRKGEVRLFCYCYFLTTGHVLVSNYSIVAAACDRGFKMCDRPSSPSTVKLDTFSNSMAV